MATKETSVDKKVDAAIEKKIEQSAKGWIVKGIDISGYIRIGVLLTVIIGFITLFFQTYWVFAVVNWIDEYAQANGMEVGQKPTDPMIQFIESGTDTMMGFLFVCFGLQGYMIVLGCMFLSKHRLRYMVYQTLSIIFILILFSVEVTIGIAHGTPYLGTNGVVNPIYLAEYAEGKERVEELMPLVITTCTTSFIMLVGPILFIVGIYKSKKMAVSYIKRKQRELRHDLTSEQKILLIENFVPKNKRYDATIELGLHTVSELKQQSLVIKSDDDTIMLNKED